MHRLQQAHVLGARLTQAHQSIDAWPTFDARSVVRHLLRASRTGVWWAPYRQAHGGRLVARHIKAYAARLTA